MVFCHGSRTRGHYLNLSLKACNVAIAIDNHILGRAKEEEYQTIKGLSEGLYAMVEAYDPDFELMMAETIWPDIKDWPGKTREDTKLQNWLFAKDLSTLIELPRERQEELRDACISLSRMANTYSKPLILRLVAA